jgi:hypothetical protein
MDADTLTLSQLFNKPVTYAVPLYQRPYVWERDKHWRPLWEDFRAVADRLLLERATATEEQREQGVPEERTASHFLGAVVVEQVPTGAGMIDRRNVIDGQQRLVTLQLFIDAARDVAAEFEDDGAKLFAKLTDNDPDLVRGQVDTFKVWPTNADRQAFVLTMRKQEDDGAGSDVSASALWEAHEYFSDAIREWIDDGHESSVGQRIDALRAVLWSLVRLVVIDLNARDNAQVIFETLNARGTPLLASDLIKNALFQQAAQHHLKVDLLYESGWKPLDAEWWRTEVTQGRLKRPRLDVFFFHWLTMRRGSEFAVHELFDLYKRYAQEQDNPAEVLADIAHYAKTYRGFESYPANTPEETFFYRLGMTQTTTATPALLFVMGQPDEVVPPEQRTLLLQSLESWLVRRLLCRLTTKNYNIVFQSLLGKLLEQPEVAGDVTAEYLAGLQGESQFWPSDFVLQRQLLSLPLYKVVGRGRLRMVLEAFEDALRAKSGMGEVAHAPRSLTIEHVLPQSWKTDTWPLLEGRNAIEAAANRDNLKHSIGNLTLLTQKLNSAQSNDPWSKKRGTLGDHTVLFLNKGLVNSYPEWDESTILERGHQLAQLACEIWPGPAVLAPQVKIHESVDVESLTLVEDEDSEAASGKEKKPPISKSHDEIREHADSPFVREAVDGIEEWLLSRGVSAAHNKGSHHSMYVGKRWIGGYYFALSWVHFWLFERDPSDAMFEGLSQPGSLLLQARRVLGNVCNEADLELFKKGVLARLDG